MLFFCFVPLTLQSQFENANHKGWITYKKNRVYCVIHGHCLCDTIPPHFNFPPFFPLALSLTLTHSHLTLQLTRHVLSYIGHDNDDRNKMIRFFSFDGSLVNLKGNVVEV